MRKMHLAPRLKLWLILGTTAGLIITALLALMLVWGSGPAVEPQNAGTPFGHPFASGSVSGAVMSPWAALPVPLVAQPGALGARSDGNQAFLALGSLAALALSTGALLAARQRRHGGALVQVSTGRLNTRAEVSPSASV